MIRLDHFPRLLGLLVHPPRTPRTRARVSGRKGLGLPLFGRLCAKKLPQSRIIAERLGLITEPVIALRRGNRRSLKPAWPCCNSAFGSGSDNFYLPHNVNPNCAIYSGTHDNNTTPWAGIKPPGAHSRMNSAATCAPAARAPQWDLIHAAYKSVCRLAITPLQDVLQASAATRVSTLRELPLATGRWRLDEQQLHHAL